MKIELSDKEVETLHQLLAEILSEVTEWGDGTVLGFECHTTPEQIKVAKKLYMQIRKQRALNDR